MRLNEGILFKDSYNMKPGSLGSTDFMDMTELLQSSFLLSEYFYWTSDACRGNRWDGLIYAFS